MLTLQVLLPIVAILGCFCAEDKQLKQRNDEITYSLQLLNLRPANGCGGNREHHRMAFFCPTPMATNLTAWTCIRTNEICNGVPDCPNSEDEDPTLCFVYNAIEQKIHLLRKVILEHYEIQEQARWRASLANEVNRMDDPKAEDDDYNK